MKETPDVIANPESETVSVRLWRMVYEAYTRFSTAMDRILKEYGLTSEQYWVLLVLEYTDTPPRIIDIANFLEHSPNGVSDLVDRMVKAGLVRRVRDRRDRRIANVFMTSKAKDLLEPAAMAVWKLMQQGMSPLSYEEKRTFAGLFNSINHKLLECVNPGADIEGTFDNHSKGHDHLLRQWRKDAQPPIAKAKHRSGKKKTAR